MNKKMLWGLGSFAALVLPITAVVSCSEEDKKETNNKQNDAAEKQSVAHQTQHWSTLTSTPLDKDDLTIDIRIPDFNKEVDFDATTFDKNKYIEDWVTTRVGTGRNRQLITTHKMVPYVIDREIKIDHSDAKTLGGLMDEINIKSPDLFKFNMDLKDAGDMGRFLMGIRKSDEELTKVKDVEHQSDWGIEWTQNAQGDWIQQGIMGGDSSYISLSSPNSNMADANSHDGFDKNESFHAFDGRLPKGVDGITVASHDVYYLNLWKMI